VTFVVSKPKLSLTRILRNNHSDESDISIWSAHRSYSEQVGDIGFRIRRKQALIKTGGEGHIMTPDDKNTGPDGLNASKVMVQPIS